ncbi:hypothetical protein M427DRAFT_70599 [Gonapodya prolifera JEL478]|uniref:Uncharacterized protein n=1 Tax=Gonapodya prolifera (strain JEL478) TaxID=1344416 RepID=A0A139ADF1_GONPJ|nr:hypothetical protein M427DRAFT_70599 [Gonapodya prolifera JEL478]|eukprot:KXS14614.1 hypothetical protein M427DRAFT_70599 [Gonapodya prolifera JEL478]
MGSTAKAKASAISTDIIVSTPMSTRSTGTSLKSVVSDTLDDDDADELTMPEPEAMRKLSIPSPRSIAGKRAPVEPAIPDEIEARTDGRAGRAKRRKKDDKPFGATPATSSTAKPTSTSQSHYPKPSPVRRRGRPVVSPNRTHADVAPQTESAIALNDSESDPLVAPAPHSDNTTNAPPPPSPLPPLSNLLRDLVRSVSDYASDIDRSHKSAVAKRHVALDRDRLVAVEAERAALVAEADSLRARAVRAEEDAQAAKTSLQDALERVRAAHLDAEALGREVVALRGVRERAEEDAEEKEGMKTELARAKRRAKDAGDQARSESSKRQEVERLLEAAHVERDEWRDRYEELKKKLAMLSS